MATPSEEAIYQGTQQLVNTATGMALQSRGIKKQVKAQGKIMGMQAKHQKDLAEFQQKQQMEMWRDTNYPAQLEQLKKAGLNAGLLYGMKGGGGVTTGTGLPTAPSSGGIDASIPTFGLMLQGQQAQIDLAKAQAEKARAEATAIGGVQTKLGEAQIANLTATTTNTEANTALQKFQLSFNEKSQEDALDQIRTNYLIAIEKLHQEETKTDVDKATKQDNITIAKEQAIGYALLNTLYRAQTGKTNAETQATLNSINVQNASIKQLLTQAEVNEEMAIKLEADVKAIATATTQAQAQILLEKMKVDLIKRGLNQQLLKNFTDLGMDIIKSIPLKAAPIKGFR